MFRGKVLLVDDFSGMNVLISGYLTASGFEVKSMRSPGEITDDMLTQAHVVLMDTETAGDGLRDIIMRVNSAGVPLIAMTSEHDGPGRLTALELGASDVVSRPLDMAELTARIRAAQSRTMLAVKLVERPPVTYGELTADITHYRVTLDGATVEMPPKEVGLLYLFMRSPGRVFTRAELSRQLGSSGSERGVNMQVSRLKKRIGLYADNIVTVRGVGYKFVG